MPRSRVHILLLLLPLLLALLSAAASAQAPLAGAGTMADQQGDSHAWIVSPATGAHKAVVLHLPPRKEAGQPGAGDGSARLGAPFDLVPQALAAWDHRAYIAFPPQPIKGGRARPVLIVGAIRGPIGGQWGPEHEGPRLPALPSLPGEGRLLGMAGSRHGPAALLNLGDAAGPDHTLLLLRGSTWKELPFPEELLAQLQVDGTPSHISLIPEVDGLGLLIIQPAAGRAAHWSAAISDDPDAATDWEWRWISLLTTDGSPAPAPVGAVHRAGSAFIYAAPARDGRGVELWSVSPVEASHGSARGGNVWRLAHIPDVTDEWAMAPLDQVGRIAILWAQRIPTKAGRNLRIPGPDGKERQPTPEEELANAEVRRFIAEVSIHTGSVLYHGPLRMRGPVSSEELRLLAIVLVALMMIIVVFVLRPEAKGPPLALPPGYALAEPGRRLSAAAMDFLFAAFITAQITGVGLLELLTLQGIITPGGAGVTSILLLLAIGFVTTTLSEWLTGRSLGKFITGCEVVRPIVDRTAEGQVLITAAPAGLWRIAVRNLVKWTVPPVAMAGLGTPERRHRGDIVAGTVVVIQIDEPEPA